MKKRKIVLGSAAALTAAATLGSCGIFEAPQQNVYGPPPTLYGPPEMIDTEDDYEKETTGSEQQTDDIAAEDDFTPEDNMIPTLYGPPEMFESDDEEEKEAADTGEAFETSFAAEENTAAPLYGPPEMFDTESTDDR